MVFVSHREFFCLAQSTQRAQRRFVDCRAPMNVNQFLLHLSYHHALHGGDAVRCSRLPLHCVSTSYFILHTSYFILHTALHGGDAVRCSKLPLHCLSTASLLHTSYFILYTSYCVAWWRRSTMQQAASPLPLYFILYTSYFLLPTALHGGDYVILHFLLPTSKKTSP